MDTVGILYILFVILLGWVGWTLGLESAGRRNRRVARERQDQAYIEYSKAEREHNMNGMNPVFVIYDEVAYMQDVQEEKQYDILGWTKKEHSLGDAWHDCEYGLDDCGPDCE